jgi:putative flippase GtrA
VTAALAAAPLKLDGSVQIRRFVLVGAGTVSVDYAVLYLMTSRMHVTYLISAAVAFMFASTLNYLLSVWCVFESGKLSRVFEFSFFLVTSLAGLVFNQLSMWLLVSLWGLNYLLAKAISILIVTAWNFFSKKKLVFSN